MTKGIAQLFKVLPLVALILTFEKVNAQTTVNFQNTLRNVVQTSDRTLEFDIYLLNTDIGQTMEMASYQAGIILNSAIYAGGTLTASIVAGSSTLTKSAQIPTSTTYTVSATIVKLAAKAPPGVGNGSIISNVSPGTRIIRLKLTSTVPFASNTRPDFFCAPSTAGIPSYPTAVALYVNSLNVQEPVTMGVNAFVIENPLLNTPVSAPAPIAVTGGGLYCQGSDGLPVGLANSENGVTYTLYNNSIAQIPSVDGTGSAITFGNQLFGTYTVSGTNASGTTPMTGSAVITENALPATPTITADGPTTFCAGGSVTLTSSAGTSYLWSNTATTTNINVTTHGSYTVQITDESGCQSVASAATVLTVNALPSAPVVSTITQTTCAVTTGSIVLSGLPEGNWTINPGSITGSTTTTTISGLAASTYNFMVTNSDGCTSPVSAVVINAQPLTPATPTVGTITQPTCAIATGSVILSGLPEGIWTINPGSLTGSTTSTTISGLAAATYSFMVANSDGCTTPVSANVVISEQPTTPTAPIPGIITQPTCTISTGSVSLSGLPATGTWTLTRNPDEITTTGTGTSKTDSVMTDGTYTYTVTNASECTSAPSGNVVINAQPVLPPLPLITAIDNYFESSSVSGNQWYNSSGKIIGAVEQKYTPPSNDNYYVLVTNADGCISEASNIISFATGIEKNGVFDGISIYPNPAKDHLVIENNKSLSSIHFEIVNSNGMKIYSSILYDINVVELNQFSSGIYYIRFNKEGSYYVYKFIKQ